MRPGAAKRFRAWLLLATFVASLGSAQLSLAHLETLDTACGVVGLSAGTEAPTLSTDSTTGPQHCAVCHFLRAVRGAGTTTIARLAVLDGVAIKYAPATQGLSVVDAVTRPSRGPPATSLISVI